MDLKWHTYTCTSGPGLRGWMVKCSTGLEKPWMLTLMLGVCGSSPVERSTKPGGNFVIHSGWPVSKPLRTRAPQSMRLPLALGGASRS
ncbi:hypothetical protein D9M69_616490 [compost metagenome]